jgi:hypothetical protein
VCIPTHKHICTFENLYSESELDIEARVLISANSVQYLVTITTLFHVPFAFGWNLNWLVVFS